MNGTEAAAAASVLGAVRIGLNKNFGPNSYVLFVGSGFAAGQAVRISASTLQWAGSVVLADGTFGLARLNRATFSEVLRAVAVSTPTGPTGCLVTIDDGVPVSGVVIDLYDA